MEEKNRDGKEKECCNDKEKFLNLPSTKPNILLTQKNPGRREVPNNILHSVKDTFLTQ